MTEPLLIRRETDGIATIRLNRPDARNALSRALMAELTAMLKAIGDDPAVKVVVLTGSGPAFCAGHDLGELRETKPNEVKALFDACSEMMLTMTRLRQPLIARVHGPAVAAGCQLVATADLAIAANTATFSTPGVNIGLFCSTPMVALSRAVGRKKAMDMLMTGRPIKAIDAETMGLINMAVPADKLDETAYGLASVIASKSPKILAIGKRAFYEQIEMSMADAYAYAGAVMARNMMEDDAAEGIDAFLAKRKPVWRN